MSTVNYVIKQLGNLIAPLGKSALASLVVILALNEFGKYSYAKKHKTQKGGNIFNELVTTVLPMSKNDLLALASILLLNYFNQQHHKGHTGKKKGGSTIYGEVVNLLAPIGVNAFGASVIILFLNDIFRKRHKHKGGMPEEEEHMMGGMHHEEEHMMGGMPEEEMMGGTFVQNIGQLVAPLGPNAFFSVSILTILSQLFDRKSFGLKSGVKHSVSELRKKLKSTISGLTKTKKKKAATKKKKAVVSKKKKSRK